MYGTACNFMLTPNWVREREPSLDDILNNGCVMIQHTADVWVEHWSLPQCLCAFPSINYLLLKPHSHPNNY